MNSLKLVTPSWATSSSIAFEAVVVHAADDLVEAVVDGAVAVRLGVPVGQDVLDPLARCAGWRSR